MASFDSSNNAQSGSCILRFITINDVYELDNVPHYASARKIEEAGATKTIGILAGDFLAPSLLSSLDKGHGKVDCMNLSGIDFVCIGMLLTLFQLFISINIYFACRKS